MLTKRTNSRLLAVLLACGLGLAHALPAQACGCCESYVVTGVAEWDNLNVRSGPSTGFVIVGTLQAGECGVQLTGQRQGDWIQVEVGDNVGWVNGKYIRWKP